MCIVPLAVTLKALHFLTKCIYVFLTIYKHITNCIYNADAACFYEVGRDKGKVLPFHAIKEYGGVVA
jgi:hypothetical protein